MQNASTSRSTADGVEEGARAGRGDGEEGLIARKYDKADGKRFAETLENLYEA